MTVNSTQKPPIWFWIVTVIGLIWNGMGVNHYLQQAYNTESFRNMYTQEQLDIVANTPTWVTAAFAIAVFAGFFGFVFILLRKKLGYTLMLLSLLAVIIQMSHILISGNASSIGMTIMIIVFAIIFVVLARLFSVKGWIK
ncbi:hypothetical protein [Lacinutrix sp. Bg11-31]|uniref:hypothetical protein n=1 Tax=Lacinutrix sp. Bg11-31 TaxID=2057808 RepID=UPI000C3146EF|nr:hypothetical protein [Lacinutrix sp. Bg11-31]AUC81365.1 hypothetical protein CW733_04135 [Lacinutrix sp. Bg11-31]